jgi:tRNA(Arg) A34 adenosine deaminase TadA
VSGDIVERLRRAADTSAGGGGSWYQLVHRCREAADEIERLRADDLHEQHRIGTDLVQDDDDDIMQRLRYQALRALVAEQHAEIKRLRAAGDALAEAANDGLPSRWTIATIAAWQEARRER